MHGHGIFHWADGRTYEGQYNNDEKHGEGKFTWPNGRVYDGSWNNGKLHGKGLYSDPNKNDGKPQLGIWKNGRRVGWVSEGNQQAITTDDAD